MAETNTIVLDKTGTITQCNNFNILYEGDVLNYASQQLIRSLSSQSIHPLSKAIYTYLQASTILVVKNFKELHGQGLEGYIGNNFIKLGSESFVLGTITSQEQIAGKVFVSINDKLVGCFILKNK